ncbi:hypothetical protein AUK41_02815 [Candidatus Berkelbacteria bacterium CG2_30_43_20]|nr:MAG: hypothetical protein AUK41_02815 [Candidatus Berkelbacteria bacterium CG2_30_43_20]
METIHAFIEKYKIIIGIALLAGATAGGVYILRPQEAQTDMDYIKALEQRLNNVEKKLDALGQVKGETVQATSTQSVVTPIETKVPEQPQVQSKPIAADDVTQPSQQSPATATVNINSASVQELDSLPGIGPTYAQRIIDYRTANGGFKSIEEIKNVKGIGDKTFEKFKDKITI